MKKNYLLLLIVLCGFLGKSCITEYVPKDIEEIKDILVVEAIITNGENTIKLGRTVGLSEAVNSQEYINDATIYIECEDGSRTANASYLGEGIYRIHNHILDVNKKYRLHLHADNEEIVSEYVMPVITPEIDEVTWEKDGMGQPVKILVSTHNDKEASPYYRWKYKEIWETMANLFAEAEFVMEGDSIVNVIVFSRNTSNNKYYCWNRDSSKALILENTDKLVDNIISKKKILEIAPDDKRLSYLYYINIMQNSLHQEAYDYFSNLQKNSEESGGLFSLMPSEMRGNMQCLTDPYKVIIGYIDVSTTTTKEMYIEVSTEIYEPSLDHCHQMVTDDELYEKLGYQIYYYRPGQKIITYAPKSCLDCRLNGATKDRPDFWPSYHY